MNKNRVYTAIYIAKKHWVVICTLFLVTLLSSYSAAITNHQYDNGLSSSIDVFTDINSAYNINDILDNQADWQGYNSAAIAEGFSKSAYWIRISVFNNSTSIKEVLAELDSPILDHVYFYITHDKKVIKSWVTGDHYPFVSREIDYRSYVFPVKMQPGKSYELFFYIKSTSGIFFPIKLWNKKQWHKKVAKENMLLGLFYGVVIVMLLYNFCFYFAIRDNSIIFYILFMGTLMVGTASLSGLSMQYFWPNSPIWANICLPFVVSLGAVWAIVFSRIFLDTANRSPFFDMLLKILLIIAATSSVLSLILEYSISIQIVALLAIVVSISLIAGGATSFIKGYRPSRLFVFAVFISLIGCLIRFLLANGFVSANVFTIWSVEISVLAEVILLSCAISDRLNVLKSQHEKALILACQSRAQFFDKLSENKQLLKEIDAIKSSESELIKSQERLSRLLDMENDAILVFEGKTMVFANHSTEEMLGYDNDELLNLSIKDIISESSSESIIDEWRVNHKYLNKWINISFKAKNEVKIEVPALIVQKKICESESIIITVSRSIKNESDLREDKSAHMSILHDSKIKIIEEVLQSLNVGLNNSFLCQEIQSNTIDPSITSEKRNKISTDNMSLIRYKTVELMQLSLDIWVKELGKDKISLAEESGIWRVYVDRSTVVTRTLDKYLRLDYLPKRPRWNYVIETAEFVLDCCPDSSDQKAKLKNKLSELKQLIIY